MAKTVLSIGRHTQAKGGDDIFVVSLKLKTVMAKSETEVSLFAIHCYYY